MSSDSIMLAPMHATKTGNRSIGGPEKQKVVLLLSFAVSGAEKSGAAGRKKMPDIRPPERWGINE